MIRVRVVVEAVEGDHAGVLGAVGRVPGDALVGRLLGDLRVELALTPAIFVFQWRCVSSIWRISSTPSMNCGNSSNCVHWL